MLINFDNIQTVELEHFNGGEKSLLAKIYNDGNNKILLGTLPPGASIGMHKHEGSSETLYILSGTGKVLTDEGLETVHEGSCHHCPMESSHSLINDGSADLVFFAVIPTQK